MPRKRPNQKLYTHVHPVLQTLRKARIDRGMTQIELSLATGYAHSQVSYTERQTRNPSFNYIIDTAEFLGYDLVLVPKDRP
jgi:transcriptional regulator with XRE-family HTH domain